MEPPLYLILNVSKNLLNLSLMPNLKGSRRRLKLLLMVLKFVAFVLVVTVVITTTMR